MTASPTALNDPLGKHDTDTGTVDAVDLEKPDTLDADSRPSADAFKSPHRQAIQADGWTSPNDPENPLNWSTVKKAYHSAIPSVYCFTVYVKDAPVTWPS